MSEMELVVMRKDHLPPTPQCSRATFEGLPMLRSSASCTVRFAKQEQVFENVRQREQVQALLKSNTTGKHNVER
jgi:hypothetical protein